MQANRLFEIIYILLNKTCVPAKELAQHLGVSTRTIYRDIDNLSSAGIPVYTEKGKGGGISLLPDFVLNKSILSDEEQREILNSLHGLANVKTGETRQVLERLSTIFNKTAVNWLEVDFSDWSFHNDYFNDFKAAILEQRIAEFEYYNSYGKKTARRIEPIQLWFKSRAWYIKGFCLTKLDMRTYRLSRLRNLVITDEKFPKRDLQATPQESPAKQPMNEYINIKLRIAPEMVYRVFDEFDEGRVETLPDGSFIATANWAEDNWVYGFILSFAEYVEVLEPAHLRDIIKAKAKKIYENNS